MESTIDLSTIKYLSFEGGGGKGIVYIGVVQALEEKYGKLGIPLIHVKSNNFYKLTNEELKRRIKDREAQQLDDTQSSTRRILGISGSSAGAITAFMVAMGMNSVQIDGIFKEFSETQIVKPVTRPAPLIPIPIPIKFETGGTAERVSISYFEKLIDDDYTTSKPLTRIWESKIDGPPKLGTTTYKYFEPRLKWAYLQAQSFISGFGSTLSDSKFLVDKLTDARVGQHIYSLIHERGMLSGIRARKVFGDLMTKYLLSKVGYNANPEIITFSAFLMLTGVDLVVTGSNLSTGKPKLFSVFHTPDFPVIEAVSISMNLPFLFKPVMIDAYVHNKYGENYNREYYGLYSDGGLVNNLPFRVFNKLSGVIIHDHDDAGILNVSSYDYDNIEDEPYAKKNWTMSFDLVNNEFAPIEKVDLFDRERSFLLGGFGGGLFDTILYSSSRGQFRNPQERLNNIEIDVTGLTIADFASVELNRIRKDKFEYIIQNEDSGNLETKSGFVAELKKARISGANLTTNLRTK